jgi:hypothetical protein
MRILTLSAPARIAAVTAALIAASVPGAFAASQDANVNISVTVTSFCTLSTNGQSVDLNLGTISNGSVDTTTQSVKVGDVVCNGPTDIRAASTYQGIKSNDGAGNAPYGFADTIQYTGQATLVSATTGLPTGSAQYDTGSLSYIGTGSSGAVNGELDASVTPQAASATSPLAASTYKDVMTVTISPQP